MKTDDFSYYLPQELIAQVPIEPRDKSRLMLVNRSDGSIKHSLLSNLGAKLKNGDVLVFNDSRVIAARLKGSKVDTGGRVEVLLLRHNGSGEWEALFRPGKRIGVGGRVEITGGFASGSRKSVIAEVTAVKDDGIKLVRFSDEEELSALGGMPLPPYIKTPLSDPGRYQTVYAAESGSAAAPTAGLHFTHELIASLRKKGVECLFTTLHIGLDTFRPVKEQDPQKHPIHREYAVISEETACKLNLAKEEARRIICVGTTTVRLLEFAAKIQGWEIKPFRGWVDLFILPGHQFRIVDGLLTNFHLPRSTLLMLVAAFSGQELIKKAYKQAIEEKYRFYSLGDCMLII
ncbi:tRNA preQ1(34) S-adenosylmethionine ribosyltransferase-isomerase QueA [Chloroflexota bacterium]